MWKMVRIPAGDIINLHYNIVVAKPLVALKEEYIFLSTYLFDKHFCIIVCRV